MTLPVLSTRQTTAPVQHPALPGPMAQLDERLQLANALSKSGDLLPRSYQNNPGACLLLIDYADRNALSLFEVAGEVSFNRGKAVASARLQKKLAARHGVRTIKVHGDAESCTVAAIGPDGKELGRATYTYQMAEALGIIYENSKNGTIKGPWKGDPAQMLFHRATTRVLDHYGPSEYAGIFATDVDNYDPTAEVGTADVLGAVVDALNAVELYPEPEPAEAELVDDEPEPATAEAISDHVSADDLLSAASIKGLSRPRLLKHAQLVLGWSGGTIDDIVADQHVAALLLAAIGADEVQ